MALRPERACLLAGACRAAVSPGGLALLAWALGVGVMLGGLQLLPSIQALAESQRGNPSLEFRSTFSLPVANLLQLSPRTA